jgi:hypothetical protein
MPPSGIPNEIHGGSPMSGMAVTAVTSKPAMRVAEPCSTDQLPVSDPYAERVRETLRQINAPDYPAGMVPWLDTVRTDLYAELTSHLPDEIRDLWTERAPLEQFEAVLARLVVMHRHCCELYRAKSSR